MLVIRQSQTFKHSLMNGYFNKLRFRLDRPANNYFKWFHVFEDELNHRGQIRID